MRGKLFGLILVALAVAVAVGLFHLSGDTPEPSNGGESTPAEVESQERGGDADPGELPKPLSNGTDDAGSRRTELPPDAVVDHSAVLTIRGKVTDAETGQPVVDAEVEVLYPDGEEIDSASTGPDGTYEVEIDTGVPPAIAFCCWADGYTILGEPPRRLERGQETLTVDFTLSRAYTIEGRVVAADGSPVEEAEVEVRCTDILFEDEWEDGETDETGYYRIFDIEDLPRTGIDVFVVSDEYAPAVKRNLSLDPGKSVLRVDFKLFEAFTVRGRVVSGVTGQPIEDAMISIGSTDPEFEEDGEEEISEEDGTFEMEGIDTVPFEGMFVLVSGDDHSPVLIDRPPQPDAAGVIDLGVIRLPGPVTLQGLVRNARDGQPVKGGDVYAYHPDAPSKEDSDYTDEATIDAQGRFELTLEYTSPDRLELYVESDGYEPKRVPVQVPPGARYHPVQVDLEPYIILRGKVFRQADGKPVAGATVRVLTQGEDFEEPIGRSRADGTFRIEIPASDLSRYSVVIESFGKRFLLGTLSNPPPGRYEVVRDYRIDVPVR